VTDDEAVERVIELLRRNELRLRDDSEDSALLAAIVRDVAGGRLYQGETVTSAACEVVRFDDVLRDWADWAGQDVTAFRADRKSFLRGPVNPAFSPRWLLAATLLRIRELGALSAEHRVSVIWTASTPSRTLPVRIPVASAIIVADIQVPLAAQYIHHELGHVLELAWRPASWPAACRWTVSNVTAEWVALVAECLARDRSWLASLGLYHDLADAIARHCEFEDRYARAFNTLVCHCAELSSADAIEEAVRWASAGLLEVGHVIEEIGRRDYWEALAAGRRRAEHTVANFSSAWGTCWWDQPEAWSCLRDEVLSDATAEAAP
jgi:hypothetical protein